MLRATRLLSIRRMSTQKLPPPGIPLKTPHIALKMQPWNLPVQRPVLMGPKEQPPASEPIPDMQKPSGQMFNIREELWWIVPLFILHFFWPSDDSKKTSDQRDASSPLTSLVASVNLDAIQSDDTAMKAHFTSVLRVLDVKEQYISQLLESAEPREIVDMCTNVHRIVTVADIFPRELQSRHRQIEVAPLNKTIRGRITSSFFSTTTTLSMAAPDYFAPSHPRFSVLADEENVLLFPAPMVSTHEFFMIHAYASGDSNVCPTRMSPLGHHSSVVMSGSPYIRRHLAGRVNSSRRRTSTKRNGAIRRSDQQLRRQVHIANLARHGSRSRRLRNSNGRAIHASWVSEGAVAPPYRRNSLDKPAPPAVVIPERSTPSGAAHAAPTQVQSPRVLFPVCMAGSPWFQSLDEVAEAIVESTPRPLRSVLDVHMNPTPERVHLDAVDEIWAPVHDTLLKIKLNTHLRFKYSTKQWRRKLQKLF
ncbi:hypothetical protein MKEN_01086000 [Mycena kentingensis (nom. inval.)]|nr:hypothetical protein MKEN_01086000 [Mycena kentingensis (nom. inval.)]